PLLSSGGSADIPPVAKLVAVVICVGLGLSPSAFATTGTGALLRSAAQLSGLTVRRPVPSATVSGRRYDSLLARSIERQYPASLQRVDARLYLRLGLMTRSVRSEARTATQSSRAWYDPAARKLLLRRTPMPGRASVINELVRALVDQHFGL